MIFKVHFLNILLPFLYTGCLFVYAYDFLKEQQYFYNTRRVFIFVTLFTHLTYLVIRTIHFNHTPITDKFEIFSLLAFTITFSYFLLELTTDIRNTGVFTLIIAFVFQVVSTIFIPDELSVPEVLKSKLLGIHVISAMLGYSGFSLSAVYGILYLLLYKKLKSNEFGLIFKRLPSLDILEMLSFKSMVIGFILLTFAIVIGAIWLPLAKLPNFSYSDPKLIATFLIWVIYGSGILAKLVGKWYGRMLIYFSLAGFGAIIFSLIVSSVFQNTFHYFRQKF